MKKTERTRGLDLGKLPKQAGHCYVVGEDGTLDLTEAQNDIILELLKRLGFGAIRADMKVFHRLDKGGVVGERLYWAGQGRMPTEKEWEVEATDRW